MKNINKILLFTIILIVCTVGFTKVEAKVLNGKGKVLDVYQIKPKEEVLVENNKILDFYAANDLAQQVIVEEVEEKVEKIEEIVDLSLQENIVNFATQFIGNPYVSGGTSLTNGSDCSGFVQSVFASFGIYLPRTTYEQSITGSEVLIENIQIGDIVSYGYDGYVSHSAIYIGDGTIVHASTPELGIRLDSLYIMPIITIRRV